ncbi:MAG: sigma-70 family RNA polymerase sigma factor [Planctomycetota bacterium]
MQAHGQSASNPSAEDHPARLAEPDDATLLRQSRSGDHGALGCLLRRHERRLFNVALGVLGNRADAQDATQDAFVSVVRKLDRFRGDAAFGTWITRVVLNASKDLLRKQKRRPAASFSSLNGHHTDSESFSVDARFEQSRELPPDSHVETLEQQQRLRDAVAGLDETFRDVLVLRDLDGMDYADIAETLELPIGTVKSRLFRARLMLRATLRPEAAEPSRTETI